MKEANHIKECKKLIKRLEKKEYFSAALTVYQSYYKSLVKDMTDSGIKKELSEKAAYIKILSFLHDIMREAQTLVEDVITSRLNSGEITDASQARKSAAGNLFQQFIAYSIAKNIVEGNINKKVIVTLSSNILDEYAVIKVGDDEQKPDSDVLVYSDDDKTTPIINFSCKTSCRERAGQTYKWKLLSDLAACKCIHQAGNTDCPITKYRLVYNPKRDIYMCFITADFYNEISNPQVAAMFNFFDKSYIAKSSSPSAKIQPLENVIDYINSCY